MTLRNDIFALLCLYEGSNPREAYKPNWFEDDGVTLRRPTDRRDNAWITENPIGGKHLKFRSQVPDRLETAYDVALGEGLLEQHLLTPEQQLSLYQCCGLPCPKQDKPWPIFPANVDALVIITNKGRAVLAEGRSAPGDAEADSPLGDYPPEYRNGGKPDGAPLTCPYLETSTDWMLNKAYVSGHYKKDGTGVLTRRVKPPGKPFAYDYKELLALRDLKTKNTDGRR